MIATLAIVGLAALDQRAYIYGAGRAAVDQASGRNQIFVIGWTYFTHDQIEFRRDEIMAERYGFGFTPIGGIAPSRQVVKFATAYNWIAGRAMAARFGAGFFESATVEARRDLVVSPGVIVGCYPAASDRFHRTDGGGDVRLRDSSGAIGRILDARGTAESLHVRMVGRLSRLRRGAGDAELGRVFDADEVIVLSREGICP